ncbi:hypothetical protein TUM17387_08850 [Shewanella carassii]|uniref:Mor transcription activator family protein n=1 Tax=Shewanella carassii TaxID=1987584 RepID=UPI001BF15F31|nr:Mor transcription activator family protein [Shewanella carassii]BCV65526.1 hypothetical protein TUM17387_08850 [Shewanella carassii]
MSIKWCDIAKNENAINIGIEIINNNSGSGLFFDEFISKCSDLGFEDKVTFKFISLLISVCGGSQIYLPKEESFKKLIVYRLVYDEFSGNNITELSKKYNISEQAVYRIVKACREADRESRKAIEGLS